LTLIDPIEFTITNCNHRNNHFNLDITIETIINLRPILDILYPRHHTCNDEKFAFIKDKITLVIIYDFDIIDPENYLCLEEL